jgi:hypothetical protein
MFTNYLHIGYMDGLSGKDPNPELDKSYEYEDGWLHGDADRKAGMTPDALLVPVTLKRGDEVRIPKGVTVKTIYHGVRGPCCGSRLILRP